jgi:general secretion pathway protein M
VSIAGSPSRERFLALALLALLLVALWAGPVSAYFDLVAAGGGEIAQQAQLLRRYQALVDAPAAAAPEKSSASALMMPQLPEAQAIALLQESVQKMAIASRVEVESLQVLRSETLSSAVKLGARISATGDIAGLARLLYAAETARPVLYPDNLRIRPRAGAPSKTTGTLEFQLDLAGFMPAPVR